MKSATLGNAAILLSFVAFLLVAQGVGAANVATVTTTHTRPRVTTTATLTETTTAVGNALGSRVYFVLVLLLAVAASNAVVGGYLWGKRRARKALLKASV